MTILREQHTRLGWSEWLQKLYTTVGQVAVFGFLAYWAKSIYDNYAATKRARLAQAAMATAAASSSAAAATPGGTDAAAATSESQPAFNEVRARGRLGSLGERPPTLGEGRARRAVALAHGASHRTDVDHYYPGFGRPQQLGVLWA